MTTLADLRTSVRKIVGDARGAKRWGDDLVDESINFAVTNYCTKMPGTTYVEEAGVEVNAAGIATLTHDIIVLERVIHPARGVLLQTKKETEDDRNPGWRSLAGDANRFIRWSANQIRLIPAEEVPVGGGDGPPAPGLTVGYDQRPVELVADDDDLDIRIPARHAKYLKYAAASWLYMVDPSESDAQQSANFMAIFNGLIGYAETPVDVEKER